MEIAHVHKTEHAKIPDNLLLIRKLVYVGKKTFSSLQNCFHIEIWTTGCKDN